MDLDPLIQDDLFTYQDFRDDRVYTYFDINKGQRKVFKIQLNASYLGRFYLPIFNCEAMYDNSVSSREGGSWVEVVDVSEK